MLSIKERLDKRDEIEMLELECRELEARLKLKELKELVGEPDRMNVFIDARFDRNAGTSTTVE